MREKDREGRRGTYEGDVVSNRVEVDGIKGLVDVDDGVLVREKSSEGGGDLIDVEEANCERAIDQE